MSYFEFNAERLRQIILNKDVIISKCPDCGCYSQFGHIGEVYIDGEVGEIIPYNLVQEYMDKYDNKEDENDYRYCYWDICYTCEGLGYLINFID